MKGKWFPRPGDEVTFNCQLISIGGQILHKKGDKAIVRDTWVIPGHYYRPLPDIWIPDELVDVKLVGFDGVAYKPNTFDEFYQQQTNQP